METFIKNYGKKSRHHFKLINFLYPELKKLKSENILEFGVSEKAMSTELFLEYARHKNCKLYSIDNVDYSSKFNENRWKFIHSRDDEYALIRKIIPKEFGLILLDTIHEATHVKKIIYKYYNLLKVNSCFFIDDISWIPYLKDNDKNRFYAEINNFETFKLLLEILNNNRENINIDFNFHGTGMCKILKLNKKKLNPPKKIITRRNSLKNFIRKIFK